MSSLQPVAGSVGALASAARLLQLASQALPTGAFAYSGGLEAALELGAINDERDGAEFLCSLLRGPVQCLELPLFLRMFDAASNDDLVRAAELSAYLLASRESGELQAQDRQMARSLRRVLVDLWGAEFPLGFSPRTFAEGLAVACVRYEIPRQQSALLVAYTWLEQHATSLARLLPLGPLASQRVVDALVRVLPEVIEQAWRVADDEVGFSCPGLGIMSSWHETQYTRIFRS